MKLKEAIFPIFYKIFGRNSFAQAGEDAVLDSLLYPIGLLKPKYLELGVCDPRNGNNTYLYHLRGGSGVLVEADETQISNIKRQRPRDVVINAGISVSAETSADFYIFDTPSINTFDKQEAESRQAEGRRLLKVAKVPLKSINQIITENFDTFPDYLSIDIEGLDFDVLVSLDVLAFPIPIICAETCRYSQTHIREKDERFVGMMKAKGYFVFADTYINTIFINSNWFKNIKY